MPDTRHFKQRAPQTRRMRAPLIQLRASCEVRHSSPISHSNNRFQGTCCAGRSRLMTPVRCKNKTRHHGSETRISKTAHPVPNPLINKSHDGVESKYLT